jgi:serine/threonine protein kinase
MMTLEQQKSETEIVVDDSIVGKIVGEKYRIVRLIGRGGMGAVYAAEHILLKKVVALKMLHEGGTDGAQALARFRNEAELTASVMHPNVVSVTDMGVLADGTAYLAMELIEGKSLAEIIKQEGKLPLKRALPVFVQLCSALAAAHEKGVLHRDLKPGNVIIVEDHGVERVKVVDFGIAKLQEGEQHLTQTGEVFGSPHYMSPEQCQGHQVSAASDIYSLGSLMHEVLTGTVPFSGDSPMAIVMAHMNEPPPPMVLEAPAQVAQEMNSIVAKAMAKQAEERFQSASELEKRLTKFTALLSPRAKIVRGIVVGAAVLMLGGIAVCALNPEIRKTLETKYNQATTKDPQQAITYQIALGQFYAGRGMYRKAFDVLWDYEKKLRLENSYMTPPRVQLLADLAEAARNSKTLHPRDYWDNPEWMHMSGLLDRLLDSKQYVQAESVAKNTLRYATIVLGGTTNAPTAVSSRQLAQALLGQGKVGEAALPVQSALALSPAYCKRKIQVSRAFEAAGDYYKAVSKPGLAYEAYNNGLDVLRAYEEERVSLSTEQEVQTQRDRLRARIKELGAPR